MLFDFRRQNLRATAYLLTTACVGVAACSRRFRLGIMSWFSHGDSMDSLVDALVGHGIIRSADVEAAMRAVDRAQFSDERELAYLDTPHPIGYAATISAPHMHAHCLEMLRENLQPGAKVLDVGSGSGYLTAVMAQMVTRGGAMGEAIGIEHIPELVANAQNNVMKSKLTAELARHGSLRFVGGDGQKGLPGEAPFDAIHVGAAAERVPPALVEQLKPGGRLLLPVGPAGAMQAMALIHKQPDGAVVRKDAMHVMYVPLTSRERQLRGWGSDY